jgi:hypothetical protein
MTAFSVNHPFKSLKYELINRFNKRVVFRDYTYKQALEACKEFPHLALRPQA